MSSTRTGHSEFDRWKDEFSATIRNIEAIMHKQADSPNVDTEISDSVSGLIQKASSSLANLSSATKTVSEKEQPALRQELLDIYKACKMQLKTYKLLYKQRELFQDSNSCESKQIETSTNDRSILFGTDESSLDSIDTPRGRAIANTQGKIMKQNSRLKDALKGINESTKVAQEISGELESQRETLETSQGRLNQFSSMTEYSKNMLDKMNRPWWRKW